ncbi:MAG: hypothetical protein HYZ17_17000 [Betaproteobacteria bacterium]|nr:hypothetical protein [Betaproteobacteria bacterium]
MSFPAFFADSPTLTLRDPLAEFLGAARGGLITYTYADAVKLAGHSCPTVAGAYLATCRALRFLYPQSTPERGRIRVEFHETGTQGVTGVMASVARLLTGATGEEGFKGIGGRFDRRYLLEFGAAIEGEIRFTRTDTSAGVEVRLNLGLVPADPAMLPLLQRAAQQLASPEEAAEFARLWQDRVRRILVEHAEDEQLIMLEAV